METVSFYRFAAAIMQLLEPEKYGQLNNVQTTSEVVAEAVANTGAQTEAQAVEAVKEHLAQAIEQASDEKIVEVAKALEDANLIDTNLTANPQISEAVATAIVETVVESAAAETIQEIKTEEILQAKTSASFWELYPELEESQISNVAAVRYLYGYAERHSLFNWLNPTEFDFNQRYDNMTGVMDYANESSALSIGVESLIRSHQTADKDNQRRETKNTNEQTDWLLRRLAEQRKLDERIAENRK